MAFALSPSVNVKEIDLSTIVPAVATSICAVAGEYAWGPCFDKKLVTNQKDLIAQFGLPTNATAKHWWSASNFLSYGNTLYVARAVDAATAENAGLECLDTLTGGAPAELTAYIPNQDAVEEQINNQIYTDGEHIAAFYAKYPGDLGNDIKIAVANAADFSTEEVVTGGADFINVFEFSPADYDTSYFGVVVLNSADQIIEQFMVSTDPTAKDFEGNSLYFQTHINANSIWINAFHNTNAVNPIDSFTATALLGGDNGTAAVTGNINLAYDQFINAEEFDVSIVMDGGNAGIPVIQQYIIDNVCESRLDCIGVLCVPSASVVNVAGGASVAATNCASYKTGTLARASSYAAIYGNWKYQYDKFNDVYRWIPISGDAAGIYARTDNQRDAWFAPAGLNRGQIKNLVKLAFSPNRAQRDTMYKSQINPCVNFASDGPVIFGQKTLQSKPSAFDRVDVRRLFIVLEKAISTASKYFLFEKNTTFTRRQLVGMIEPFLRMVQGREGIYEFHVECSEINNTPQIIDMNTLVCDIFIQPTKTAEYISLNFIATRTGVDFSEYIGKSF